MSGYIGSKAVLLSTTAAVVTGNSTVGGNLTVDTNTLFVDAANNRVGVGTSSPSQGIHLKTASGNSYVKAERTTSSQGEVGFNTDNWYMYQKTGGTDLHFYNTADRITIDSSGNVGIGTSSPAYKLDVSLANNEFILAREASGNITNGFRISGPANENKAVFSANSATGEVNLGAINTNYFLTFSTNGANERMRIDSSGNVGIGESNPQAELHINDATGLSRIRLSGGAVNADNFEFGQGTTGVTNAGFEIRDVDAAATRMVIDSSGNVLVGTTASEGPSRLSVVQTATNQSVIACRHTLGAGEPFIRFINSSNSAVIGSIANSGNTGTSYNTSSDYRLKENVVPLSGAADRLAQIPVHRFNFIADPDRTVDGFLAHEVQEVVPECVTGTKDQVETVEVTDEDGNVTTETRPVYQGIDQSKLVPLLTAALQEALTKIDALEARIVILEGGAA